MENFQPNFSSESDAFKLIELQTFEVKPTICSHSSLEISSDEIQIYERLYNGTGLIIKLNEQTKRIRFCGGTRACFFQLLKEINLAGPRFKYMSDFLHEIYFLLKKHEFIRYAK